MMNPSHDAPPFFFDMLREEGFVDDLHWTAQPFEVRARCLRLAAHIEAGYGEEDANE